jgi:hypothetical protein
MSTRCNIKLVDGKDELWFYRHSDGYPDGAMPVLELFIKWMKDGKIRNNISQSSGWLIVLGALEYNTIPTCEVEPSEYSAGYAKIDTIKEPSDWKVGSIEPTTGMHGDIEWLYTIDLQEKTIKVEEV